MKPPHSNEPSDWQETARRIVENDLPTAEQIIDEAIDRNSSPSTRNEDNANGT